MWRGPVCDLKSGKQEARTRFGDAFFHRIGLISAALSTLAIAAGCRVGGLATGRGLPQEVAIEESRHFRRPSEKPC